MRHADGGSRLQVESQRRAYAVVVGVTVVMLVVGLAIPLLFGRTPAPAGPSSLGSEPTFAPVAVPTSAAPTRPGATVSPGHVVGPAGTTGALPVGPTAGPTLAGSTGSVPGAGQGPLTASDQGVTPTSIKLGVILLDIQALTPLGFAQPHFSPQEQRQQHQFFIDQINRSGGILGRRVVPDFKTVNALDSNGSQSPAAVCQQMADDKVFAVMGVPGAGTSCLTVQHGLPTITNTGALLEVYRKSRNLLVSPHAAFERQAANWADLVSRSGLLKGRKIGTVSNTGPDEARPEQALADTLKGAGHPATYRAHISSDQGSAQSQMPIEVQKMRSAGVDLVFLAMNFAGAIQFVQTAERQGFRPQYVVSDLGSLTAEGLVSNMPASFDGAYAWMQTNAASPEQAEDRKCRLDWNAATGNQYAAGNESGGLRLWCWMAKTFAAGARAAGPELTRAGFATAVQGLREPSLPLVLGGSFRAGKTDFADYMRTARYARECKCYRPVGGGQKGRY